MELGHLTLGELIEVLQKTSFERVCPVGFKYPHSYRGNYSEIAFEPTEDVTVEEMHHAAVSALNTTYTGWHGGDFIMDADTPVHIAEVGCIGEPLVSLSLKYMMEI